MIGRWAVVNALLTLIIVALGVQIARTWMRTLPVRSVEISSEGEGDDAARRRRPPRARRDRSGDAAAVLAVITEKNLFDPERRTAAGGEALAQVEDEPPEPPTVTVVGVRLIGGDAEAVVEDSTKGKEQRRVRAGDAIGDYTVDEIRETSVLLSSAAGQSVTLWLNVGAGSAPPAKARRGAAARRRAAGKPTPGAAAARRNRQSTRRAAQRARQRNERVRAERSRLPQGVRERLEQLREK